MPKLGEAQARKHPWKKQIDEQVQAALMKKALKQKKLWTCPNCGSATCAFGEECRI